jgi:hypothetical protein
MSRVRPILATVALVSALSAACSAPLLKLPPGPGALAPDGRVAIDDATAACRRVSTITLEIAVSGSIGGHRTRGRLSAGLARPASARLEAVAPFGQPLFIFVANGDDATLLLPRDQRALEHARPDAVLEAIAGVPLDASALLAVVTGCAAAPDAASTRALGDTWRVAPDGSDEVYFNREGSSVPWRLVATVHRAPGAGWRAEYRNFQNGLPQSIRLVSAVAGRFDLQLALSQIDVNTPLAADVFRLPIPASAAPITLDELKQSGPLSANAR